MAAWLAPGNYFTKEKRQRSDDRGGRASGIGSRACVGSTRLCSDIVGGQERIRRTRAARIRFTRVERMAACNGLAFDTDQEDEKCFGLSIQPDDCRRDS